MVEIKKANDIIRRYVPDFEFLKWNDYSIIIYEESNRFCIVRKPNLAYKIKTSIIIPFIFIPYCFWFGFINVKRAIRDSYKGSWVVMSGIDENICKELLDYAKTSGNK